MPDEHMKGANPDVTLRTEGCEEHLKAGDRNWVALNVCLTCGHVGCCDSTPGQHATQHFKDTGHPVAMRLPKPGWVWCYVHETMVE